MGELTMDDQEISVSALGNELLETTGHGVVESKK
jgi:hypothetical protein